METRFLPAITAGYFLQKTVILSTMGTWIQIANPNPSRWQIMFTPTGSLTYLLAWYQPTTTGEGIQIYDGSPPFTINYRDSPPLCCASWYLCGMSAGVPFNVWETLPVAK